jgi:hypothetical protein
VRPNSIAGPGRTSADLPEIEHLRAEDWPNYEQKLEERIKRDRLALRFFDALTAKHGFETKRLLRGFIRTAIEYRVPDRLKGDLEIWYDSRLSSGRKQGQTVAEKARSLANEIVEAGPQDFVLNYLHDEPLTDAKRRKLASLPKLLRLYADYHDQYSKYCAAMGKITRSYRSSFENVARDDLQNEIYRRTGHYSDERYCRILNHARQLVGKDQINPKALLQRRKRNTKL